MKNITSFGLGCLSGIVATIVAFYILAEIVAYVKDEYSHSQQMDPQLSLAPNDNMVLPIDPVTAPSNNKTASTSKKAASVNTITVKGKNGKAEVYVGMPLKDIKEVLGEPDESEVYTIMGHEIITLIYNYDSYHSLHVKVEDGKLKETMKI